MGWAGGGQVCRNRQAFYHGDIVLAFVATAPTDDNPEEITADDLIKRVMV